MAHHGNPFLRGYHALTVRRVLCITEDDHDRPPCYRPLHASQAHLSDDDVQGNLCIFCDDYVLVADKLPVPEALEIPCRRFGIARNVVYEITGRHGDALAHVGDVYSLEAAQRTIEQIRFDTGVFSRCWEISSRHLSEDGWRYLTRLADAGQPSGLLFEAFRVPASHAIGCKLIATPWTDEHLRPVDVQTVAELREEHREAHVPETLIDLLHQAGEADVRVLIFDADARPLDGLPLFGF
ncbi:Uncharacterised protein [Burkholderia pseudomallei]|uniref:DUF5983 family protein n=1 Tax=Burkholderia pseudomallei TaxID=28450 RepID=UPI000F070BA3|nr:ABC transporter substrate-binding protein [Burkholderia pseudomallei]CAJ2756342.1 Uncharacterised protein [Burkholderia pseudomallei]VCJ93046.1 Uncharacterised protein [Burkholderia pseudomallei]VCJ95234.1 Uncharacterised protein [Burkholderia pseudomallei]VCJ95454.1 Uncharacterised protein [Burkholderia pseudomallei]VCJ97906.1 Uncharacterised protein [Burkholderia pseudomallei]